MKRTAVVLRSLDEAVLPEVPVILDSLDTLGYHAMDVACTLDFESLIGTLRDIKPLFCFNLVEELKSDGRLIYLVPTILAHLDIPYTGGDVTSLFNTSNKVQCKEILAHNGIMTPAYFYRGKIHGSPRFPTLFIAKPVWEDGSTGINDENVFMADDPQYIDEKTRMFSSATGKDYFSEQYIGGREFNVSLLVDRDRCEILPVAELVFSDYPSDRPKIVGFNAKWKPDTFEYHNTNRSFSRVPSDRGLIERIEETARRCWDVFNIQDYARVDIRIDGTEIHVIDVNMSPSLSPDAGFVAAAGQRGLDYTEIIRRILTNLDFPDGR